MPEHGVTRTKRRVVFSATEQGDQFVAEASIVTVGTHTSASPVGVTVLTAPAGSRGVLIQSFTAAIRYTLDMQTQPSATVGFRLLPEDGVVLIPVSAGGAIRVIAETAGATVEYQWIS